MVRYRTFQLRIVRVEGRSEGHAEHAEEPQERHDSHAREAHGHHRANAAWLVQTRIEEGKTGSHEHDQRRTNKHEGRVDLEDFVAADLGGITP